MSYLRIPLLKPDQFGYSIIYLNYIEVKGGEQFVKNYPLDVLDVKMNISEMKNSYFPLDAISQRILAVVSPTTVGYCGYLGSEGLRDGNCLIGAIVI